MLHAIKISRVVFEEMVCRRITRNALANFLVSAAGRRIFGPLYPPYISVPLSRSCNSSLRSSALLSLHFCTLVFLRSCVLAFWRWFWKSPPHASTRVSCLHKQTPFSFGLRGNHFGIRSSYPGLRRYRPILRPIFLVGRFNRFIHSFQYHSVHHVLAFLCLWSHSSSCTFPSKSRTNQSTRERGTNWKAFEIRDFGSYSWPNSSRNRSSFHRYKDPHQCSIITFRSKDLRVGLDLEIDKAMQSRASDWRDMYQHVTNAIILHQQMRTAEFFLQQIEHLSHNSFYQILLCLCL
jgi:hypothetical protein